MQGERPIAWNYGFRYGTSWLWYQPTFDGQFEQYSTGNLLLASIIVESCQRDEQQIVDLGMGAEGYKERFANATRETLHVTVSCSISRTVGAFLRYRVAEAIKKSPRLETAVRKDIARIANLRRNWKERTPAGFASWAFQSALRKIAGTVTVRFYRWPREVSSSGNTQLLRPLDLDQLSCAAMRYEGDQETQAYILRAAQRLQDSSCEGFILQDGADLPVHFGWSTPFDGFLHPELRLHLNAPEPAAAMIFDCWTPVAQRRRGYFRQAIAQMAKELARSERAAWISSLEPKPAASRAIENAGFQFAYSMTQRGVLGRKKRDPSAQIPRMKVGESVRS
jgi:hypothetical protein